MSTFDAAACAAWLGVKVPIVGVDTGLPARLVKLLVEAFDAGLFDENDVPGPTDVLGAEDIKARLLVWGAVIEDACKISTPAKPVLASEKLRFGAWFCALYQGTVSMNSSSKLVVITPEIDADLKAQHMATIGELAAFELVLALGRPVGLEETEGFNYGNPYMHMAGAIRSAKVNKGSGRGKTLDTLLSDALLTGDKGEVKRFFTDLCHRLTSSNLVPYYARAAIQILTFVSKADLNIRDELSWTLYMIEYRQTYMGRGLPVAFDVELAIAAKETADDKRRKGTAPRITDGLAAREHGLEPGTGQAIIAAISDLKTSVSEVGARLDGCCKRLDRVELGQSGDGGAPKVGKCWICQSDGHLAANCPTAKGKELRDKKSATAAAKAAVEAK
jgi:hypothetical protein